jgi:mono/diheme cytochrome c family protein
LKEQIMRIGVISICVICAGFLTHVAIAQDNTAVGSAANRFDYAELAKAPAKARGRKNPQEGNAEAVLIGKKLFGQHCAECHGSTAEGGKNAPSLLATEVQQATPGALFWLLTNGVVRRGMPVWSKLPEPQRWAIVTYVKSLKPSSQPARVDGTTTSDSGLPDN